MGIGPLAKLCATIKMTSARPLDITTNIDRFEEAPPPPYNRKVGKEEAAAPTMAMAEYKRMQAETEKAAAQAEVDRMKELASETRAPPFSIPRVDHCAAGTLDDDAEKSMFYATNNAMYHPASPACHVTHRLL